MHQFQEARLRARLAQLFDHAKAHAAAAVHGRAGGLVDGDQVLVFQQDGEFARGRGALRLVQHLVGHAHGGQTHQVARCHARVGAGAPLVQADLAAADDAVDVGLGHALQVADEEIVEPLARGFGVDLDDAGRRGFWRGAASGRFAPYNVFHLRDECVSG